MRTNLRYLSLSETVWEWPGGHRDQASLTHSPATQQQFIDSTTRGRQSTKLQCTVSFTVTQPSLQYLHSPFTRPRGRVRPRQADTSAGHTRNFRALCPYMRLFLDEVEWNLRHEACQGSTLGSMHFRWIGRNSSKSTSTNVWWLLWVSRYLTRLSMG